MTELQHRFDIKPVSANNMFAGAQYYLTKSYREYRKFIKDVINKSGEEWPFGKDEVKFIIHVGFSRKTSDLDNAVKPLLDAYQEVFNEFNDKAVTEIFMKKHLVPKNKEYIDVNVSRVTPE